MPDNKQEGFLPGMSPSDFGKKREKAGGKKTPPLFFSFSRLTLYEECPQKYKFKYVDKIPEKPKPYFAFGHSIHSALEFLYKVKSPPFPSLREVLDFFEKDWNKISWIEKGYSTEEKHMQDFIEGKRMIEAYYKKHMGKFTVPFLLEYTTDVEVDGLKVRIVADKIDYTGEGKIIITDYKTGKDIKRSPEQLYMYQKICELDEALKEKVRNIYGEKVEKIRAEQMLFYHIPSLTEHKFERASSEEIRKFWSRVLNVSERIRQEKFEPNPGEFQCKFCDFRQYCPIFANEEYIPQERKVKSTELEEAAKKFLEISEKQKKIEEEVEILKSKLVKLFKKEQIQSFSVEGKEIKLVRRDKWVFDDREEIIKILKENNLYNRVSRPLMKEILNLINDSTLPNSIRRKISDKGKKTEIWNFEIE